MLFALYTTALFTAVFLVGGIVADYILPAIFDRPRKHHKHR